MRTRPTEKSLYFLQLDRSSITMRPMLKNFQVFSWTGRSPIRIRPTENFSYLSQLGRSPINETNVEKLSSFFFHK